MRVGVDVCAHVCMCMCVCGTCVHCYRWNSALCMLSKCSASGSYTLNLNFLTHPDYLPWWCQVMPLMCEVATSHGEGLLALERSRHGYHLPLSCLARHLSLLASHVTRNLSGSSLLTPYTLTPPIWDCTTLAAHSPALSGDVPSPAIVALSPKRLSPCGL